MCPSCLGETVVIVVENYPHSSATSEINNEDLRSHLSSAS